MANESRLESLDKTPSCPGQIQTAQPCVVHPARIYQFTVTPNVARRKLTVKPNNFGSTVLWKCIWPFLYYLGFSTFVTLTNAVFKG